MNEHSVGFALKESMFSLVGDEREQALTVMRKCTSLHFELGWYHGKYNSRPL